MLVALKAGGAIRGRLVRPARATMISVWVEGPGFRLPGALYPDGSFQVPGVPAGDFTIVAEAQLAGKPIRATAPARSGDTVELTLGAD